MSLLVQVLSVVLANQLLKEQDTKMKKIINLVFLFLQITSSLQFNHFPLMKALGFKKPYIFVQYKGINSKNLLKAHFQRTEMAVICHEADELPEPYEKQTDSLILFAESVQEDMDRILDLLPKSKKRSLIMTPSIDENMFKDIKIEIDHEILFFSETSNELFEAYSINDQTIVRNLGTLKDKIFMWNPEFSSNFIRRRSNFQGITLKVMTEFEGLSINADSAYLTNAPYFPENQTHLLNGFTYGMYQEVLELLEDQLNFTSQIFKRKDGQWGMVYPQEDGTYKTSGFIGDLFLKKADFAIGNVIILEVRAQFVDYLPAVGKYQGMFEDAFNESKRISFDFFCIRRSLFAITEILRKN